MSDDSHAAHPDEPIDVLLVEDNAGDVRLVREAFDATDGETTIRVVDDGDDAVAFLTAARDGERELPDLVLLDLKLPGRDGYEVLEAIRSDSRLQYLPVVVLTGSEAEADVGKCYDARANAYLTKPTESEGFVELAERIERFWFDHVQLPPVPQ